MSVNSEKQLEKKRELESFPTCSICNTKIANEHSTNCSSCNKIVHKDCCKLLRDLIICRQCADNPKHQVGGSKSLRSSKTRSTSSSAKKRELRLKCLEEEKALKLKELAIEKEFLAKKYSLLEQEIESDEEEDDRSKGSVNVESWVKDVQQRNQKEVNNTLNPSAPIFHSTQRFQVQPNNQVQPPERHQFTANEVLNACQEATVQLEPATCGNVASGCSDELTKSQMNARKIVSELPKFYGKPKEWPNFISSFVGSTSLCGFRNFENIARLRSSLKGIAFEAVWPQLTINGDVDGIIKTLTTLFGRPELIIKELESEIIATKPIKEEDLLSIMNFAMGVQNLVAVIQSSAMSKYMDNPTLMESLVKKLPATLKLQWGARCLQTSMSDLVNFNQWIQEVSLSARMVTNEVPKPWQNEVKSERRAVNGGSRLFLNVHEDNVTVKECKACGMKCEFIWDCTKFRDLDLKKKWDIVNSSQLCRTCLEPRHKRSCPNEKICSIDGCTYKHHPLLHKFSTEPLQHSESTMVHTHTKEEQFRNVFYKIVPVRLHGPNVSIETFAFLDDGSGLTLIDQELSDQLNISGLKQPLCLNWTSNYSRLEENSKVVSVGISSLHGQDIYQMSDVRTVENLALPTQTLSAAYLQSFQHLRNLPIVPYSVAKPRILIGLKYMKLAISLKTFEGREEEPICILTRLGYVVFGNSNESRAKNCHSINVHKCDCELHQLVNTYFSLENVGVIASERSLIPADEKRAINILKNTTKKIGQQFETGLLWRYDDVKLPDNLVMAKRRLQCLKKKLNHDHHLSAVMREQISDHLSKGYIRELSREEASIKSDRTWYLPIFPVTNPNKPNKVRIVWDAAAKLNGISLNSMLIKGPDQLSSLVGVLQRFRQHRFAVSGDIMQMFHQVKIRREDQDSQRFLWFNESGEEVTYVMQVMTFGSSCSPSCAQYVKNLNAESFSTTHPRAVIGITKNHYVDDFLDSMPTEGELLSLVQDVKNIHSSGGFRIRNWISNSQAVLDGLEEKTPDEAEKHLNICTEMETEKILGMLWSTKEDVFKYRLKINDQNKEILLGRVPPTKRQILSVMMQIFDPLGFLANIMINVKLILQEVWKSGVDWDEQIKVEQFLKWKVWLLMVSSIEHLKIPRWHFKTTTPENLQLHVFVDGSLLAYSAVAYFRSQEDCQYHCSLIGAKGKVASMKLTSVPRIELMGALIGARFAKSIKKEHFSLAISRTVFWCDSVTVLKWIKNDQLKFKQFVGFRVGEILELSNANEWRYVPSKLNIADQATKSSQHFPTESNKNWFYGPEFLCEPESEWPENIVNSLDENLLELREVFAHSDQHIPHLVKFEKYSSWKKLCRVVAWVHKAISTWKAYRRSTTTASPILDMSELHSAENFLIRQCQFEAFPDEMIILSKVKEGSINLKLEKTSPLYKETPYIDECGVARRRGRIDAADVALDVKRPILLPKHHALTFLIIRHFHEMYKHANDETVINEILQKYVTPSVRVQLKTVKERCQKCKNDRAVPEPPLMAELPPSRLQGFARPFSFVGADYFGPIMITVRRKPEKRWVMLLTCLTVRAIHVEIAATLTTDSCIMCVNRFIARRGQPIEFISDNGTNMKGAANELKAFLENDDNQLALQSKFTTTTMKWKFITPGAPHMGGSWERLVRSVKTTLSQIMPISNPSEELLHTLLCEVEAVVNSRPLTYVGVENRWQEALTPNHFLIGSSSGSKPIGSLPEFYEEHTVLRKQWMTAQQLSNQFWIRWVREYLPQLSRRTKWYESKPKVEVGDIVILFDEQTARCSWPKGVVIETIKSKADNEIRSAVVRTQSGTYTRPVTKMAVLDINGKCPEDPDHLRGELLTIERSGEKNLPPSL